jgi:hypothetical protein
MRMLTRDIYSYLLKIAILSLVIAGFTARSGKAQADATSPPRAQLVIDFMRERKHA